MASAVMRVVSQRSFNLRRKGAGCKCCCAGFLPHYHLYQNLPDYYTSTLNPYVHCKNLEMTKLRVCGSIGNDAGLTSLSSSTFWRRSSTTSAFGEESASLYRFNDPIVVAADDDQHRRISKMQRKRRMG